MKKNLVVVHCSDTPAKSDIGSEEITRWHTDPPPKGNGWKAIGYAFVIRRNGVIEKGRDLDGDGDALDEVGAHAAGSNARSVGICLAGGKPAGDFTADQLKSLRFILMELDSRFPGIEILGHRDLPGVTKSCPTFDVRHWWKTGEVV